jgi:15-cis-phytoene synthase
MARNTSFYYSFLVLPPDQRRGIVAVWDFCRAVDDAVDEAPRVNSREPRDAAPAGGHEAVQFWRAELARCYNGAAPVTDQGRALQPFVSRFHLPRDAFDDVIDGVAMDLEKTRYRTFDELFEYCRRVASAVGIICIKLFGCRGRTARDYALNLGVALQLTNILRDVEQDLDRGRLYLPLEDLDACGCTIADLEAKRPTDPVRRVIALECRRAREYYGRSCALLPDEDRRRLLPAEIMRGVYFETLTRIEARGYDVFSRRVRVPRPRQALIALREWLMNR